MFSTCLTIESVVHIGSLIARDGRIDAAESMLEDLFDGDVLNTPEIATNMIKGSRKDLEEAGDREFAELMSEIFAEWAYRTRDTGKSFVVQFAYPVMSHFVEDDSGDMCSYSWGYYYTKWVWAEDVESAFRLAYQWAEECHEKDRKEDAERREKDGA